MNSVKLFGKNIPITKNGLPNLRSLNKEQREALRSFLDKEKEKEKKEIMKELEDFFSNKK
jgi:ABC-type phosphate/phosphonate transport system substrate-binding protein